MSYGNLRSAHSSVNVVCRDVRILAFGDGGSLDDGLCRDLANAFVLRDWNRGPDESYFFDQIFVFGFLTSGRLFRVHLF